MLEINGTIISLTRGDSAYIHIPVLDADGNQYVPQEGDSVALQVRTAPVSGSGSEPQIIIEGDISFDQDGVPLWHISPSDSTIEARPYTWDVQMELANGDVCTYNSGTLNILPENTVLSV